MLSGAVGSTMSGVVLDGAVEVVGLTFARGEIFTISIGSVYLHYLYVLYTVCDPRQTIPIHRYPNIPV